MGTPTEFYGANTVLRAPAGSENISDMHTYTNGMCSVSCWELDPAELAEIVRTGRVFVSVFSGPSQPPIYAGSEDSTRDLVVDYGGVWQKGNDR